jgi:hypothetical protein
MLLQHEDLDQLNVYTREINRLMFRSLFGCGVICGLVVEPTENCGKVCVTVGAGLAIDCCGNPVYVPKKISVAVDENCDPNLKPLLYVLLCGTTKCCAPRTSMCATDDDEMSSQCTRERDAFEIRIVRERPKCACRCDHPKKPDEGDDLKPSECWCIQPEHQPCYKDHYDGICDCDCGECSGDSCECILLARLDKDKDGKWVADHRVRRFIRPVLMRDPQVAKEAGERNAAKKAEAEYQTAPEAPAKATAKKKAG